MPLIIRAASKSLSVVGCPRCRLRSAIDIKRQARARARSRCASSSTSNQVQSQPQPQSRWALLSNKRLIRLSGPDAANFLHNIIPAKILGVGTTPIYTAFLSAQGRILQDVFIYPPSWEGEKKHEWLIEVDADSAIDLLKHLKKHKLRAKFAMEVLSDHEAAVWYRWPTAAEQQQQQQQPHQRQGSSSSSSEGVRAGGSDPRPGMGTRLVLDSELQRTIRSRIDQDGHRHHHQQADATTIDVPLVQYTIHRMLNGLAEGQKEIISGQALPQECNIDFLGGIDFHKGCYLGQELTIRTHHTGVVRKRILPCQIYPDDDDNNNNHATRPKDQNAPKLLDDEEAATVVAVATVAPPAQSNISKLTATSSTTSTSASTAKRRGRSTGKWLGGVANVGLALCRLEMMTDIQLTAETTTATYSPDDEYCVQWVDGGGEQEKQQEEEEEAHSTRIRPFVPAWVRAGIEQSLHRKQRKPRMQHQQHQQLLDDDDEELD